VRRQGFRGRQSCAGQFAGLDLVVVVADARSGGFVEEAHLLANGATDPSALVAVECALHSVKFAAVSVLYASAWMT